MRIRSNLKHSSSGNNNATNFKSVTVAEPSGGGGGHKSGNKRTPGVPYLPDYNSMGGGMHTIQSMGSMERINPASSFKMDGFHT